MNRLKCVIKRLHDIDIKGRDISWNYHWNIERIERACHPKYNYSVTSWQDKLHILSYFLNGLVLIHTSHIFKWEPSRLILGAPGPPMNNLHAPSPQVNHHKLKFHTHPTVTHCWFDIQKEKRRYLSKPLNLGAIDQGVRKIWWNWYFAYPRCHQNLSISTSPIISMAQGEHLICICIYPTVFFQKQQPKMPFNWNRTSWSPNISSLLTVQQSKLQYCLQALHSFFFIWKRNLSHCGTLWLSI